MDKQLQLEIYEVLRASKALQDFNDKALQDFVANVNLHVLPAQAGVDPEQYNSTEWLSVVFKGHLICAVKSTGTADEVIYELGSGDVLGVIEPISGLRDAPQLQTACETTIACISWPTIDHHLQKIPGARKSLEDALWHSSRRAQLAVHLYRFFGDISSDTLADFESRIEWQFLNPSDVLFHQGDQSSAVFFVLSGLLYVALEENGKIKQIINEIRSGEIVGEIAYLTEARRSATVYAVRDTLLARLSYSSFDILIDKYPVAMKHIARLVSKRLQRLTFRDDSEQAISTIISVVSSNPGYPLSEAARHLVMALKTLGPTLHLDATTVDKEFGRQAMSQVGEDDPGSLRLAQWLHQQEAKYQYVVYEADRSWSPWTQRAIRHADEVVIFAAASSDPKPGTVEEKMDTMWTSGRGPARSLVLLHPEGTSEPQGTARWLAPRKISRHFHARERVLDDFSRLARILTGKAIELVLGGGGARGYAHIGLVRAMEETGIPIDIVGGTSMGAILSGLVAMQYNSQRMHESCEKYISSSFDYTLPLASLIKGGKIRASLDAVFGERQIEDLWLPYFCVATNLTQAEQVVHRRGSLAEAIRSSLSLPGILLPCYHNGDLLVDGGVVNNLPFDVMRSLFKGNKVIAVDVEPKKDLSVRTRFSTEISGWALALNRLNPFRQAEDIPSIVSILIRSATLASVHATNRLIEQNPPDLYLHLPVEAWGTLAFDAIDDIADRGYETSLPKLQSWLSEYKGSQVQ